MFSNRAKRRVDHYRQGLALYLEGKHEQALEHLDKVTGPAARDGDAMARTALRYAVLAHRAIGLAALAGGQFEQAQTHLQAAIRCGGNRAELAGSLACAYGRTGRHERAAEELEQATRAPGGQVAHWRQLAQAQWRAGRRTQAYMTLVKALRLLGGEAELHLQMGLFYALEGRWLPARSSLARAAEADCANPDIHHYLGLAHAALHEPLAAVKSLQRALELRPGDLTVAYRLATAAKVARQGGADFVIHLGDGSPLGVGPVRQLCDYVAAEPDFLDAILSLPSESQDTRLLELLLQVTGEALQKNPLFADLRYHRGRILEQLGRADEALEEFSGAVALNGQYVKALVALAYAQARRQDWPQAVENLQQAIELGADWPDVHCTLARWLISVGHRGRAKTHAQRALQLKPNFKPAAEVLTSLAA